jgi:regulator of sigma E protease
MLTALVILLGLGVLIGFHEASHMIVGKLFGVKVLKFSLGFGPVLLSKQIGETSYELRALPLGGFVQFYGECPESRAKRGFFSVSWYKRSIIALAGPIMNLVLGFLLLLFLVMAFKGYPFMEGVRKAFEISSFVIIQTLGWIGHGIAGKAHMSEMAGPIMVTKIMVDALKVDVSQFLFVLSIISLSLGLFNILPIPGLDGGHVFLYTIEGALRKRLSRKVYEMWSKFGTILLIILMGFIIFSDIIKLVVK